MPPNRGRVLYKQSFIENTAFRPENHRCKSSENLFSDNTLSARGVGDFLPTPTQNSCLKTDRHKPTSASGCISKNCYE